jgi:hypothetical protein
MGTAFMGLWLLPSSDISVFVQSPPKSVAVGDVAKSRRVFFVFLIATLLLRLTFSMVGHSISRSVRVAHLAVLTDFGRVLARYDVLSVSNASAPDAQSHQEVQRQLCHFQPSLASQHMPFSEAPTGTRGTRGLLPRTICHLAMHFPASWK